MATVSGGSKPNFTVDQVLHAVEMNQLNQEWIVDSVPAGSAGKNGDVVFVINQGGVWAKVSGSWVQATLTSADMQALQDQVDAIQSNGYDDSELRGLISDEETARIAGDDALDTRVTKNETDIAAIVIPNVSDFTTKTYVDAADATKFDKGATSYADAKAMEDAIEANADAITTINNSGYNDTELRGLISDEETARAAGDQNLQNQIDIIQSGGYDDTQLRSDFAAADAATLSSANAYTDQEVSAITVPDVSDLATKTEVSDGDTATLTTANAYTDAEIAKIPDTDVSNLATKEELSTGLAGKADEPHTHDTSHTHDEFSDKDHTHPPQDLTHDHDTEYAPVHNHPYASDDHSHPPQDLTHDHQGEYQPVGDYPTKTEMTAADAAVEAKIPDVSNFATKTELTNGLAEKADDDHVHIQTGSGLTFDPSREGQIVQSTNGTDWTAGMSLRVVTSVPDDTEGEIGDVVFVVGA